MAMERKLVTIQKVESVVRHPGADALDLVKVLGWRSVAKLGLLKPGDLVVWHEIDSFIPPDHPTFEELSKNAIEWRGKTGVRIRTLNLRKQLSQGLARPISEFPILKELEIDLTPGEVDIAALIGVQKWEKEIPEGSNAKAGFPSFLRKTDQPRIQNIWDEFGDKGEMRRYATVDIETGGLSDPPAMVWHESAVPYNFIRNTPYEVTLKLDGTSMTVFWRDGDFGVCGKDNEWTEDPEDPYWKTALRLKLKERLQAYGKNIALQGELYGPGSGVGNHDRLPELDFYVYDIFDIENYTRFGMDVRMRVLSEINVQEIGELAPPVKHVPLVEVREFDFATLEDAMAYADGDSITPGVKREGVVFKSIENPEMSFKIISNPYLLKHGG